MKLVATIPLRNEDWVCGLSLRVALMWCDEIVVLMHECTDGTQDIVEQVIREHDNGRVHVLRASGEWTEMQHRQMMLEFARERGATHIAIVDADEVLSGDLLYRHMPVAGQQMYQLPLYYLRGWPARYHTNGIWGNRIVDLVFRDDKRLSWPGDCFHSRAPRGAVLLPYRPIRQGDGGVMHLWGLSERRLKAKCALYKVTERIRWPQKSMADIERMYSWAIHGEAGHPSYGTPYNWTYAEVPAAWWAPYQHLMEHLHVDAEPWQEREVQRLTAQYGRERFAGLDLFGLV